MQQISAVFLSEMGITSTSANHLANLAQEHIKGHEVELANINFVTTSLDIVGSPAHSGKVISQGYTSHKLAEVPRMLAEMAEMNAFCAWAREAIKAKEREQRAVLDMTFEQWCHEMGHELPEYPYEESITEDDIIAQMNIKERNRYLTLEAEAATIGKFIHAGRELSLARAELKKALSKPYDTKGEGTDTLIYHHTASVEASEVEALFFDLQKEHREKERELNQIKWAIKQKREEAQLAQNTLYRERLMQATERTKELESKFSRWQTSEHARISKLKIAIPQELTPTFERLNTLAEKREQK